MPWDYHGHWVEEHLLIFWLCLVSFIVYAQLSRWVYSFLVVWLVAYFLGPELSTLLWESLLILGFISLTVWQHAHAIRAQYDKVCADTATATTRSGILAFVNCAGEEYHYAAVTDVKHTGPVALGCRPHLSWSREPGDWDISLLVSKVGGVVPSVYFNITPPDGRTANVKAEAMPHEGEKTICLQFKLGVPWALGSGAPISDQQFWSGWDFDTTTGMDVVDAGTIDEKVQVNAEDVQKQETAD